MRNFKILIKILLLGIILHFNLVLNAQDTLKVESKVDKAVVFLKGAQIHRTAKCFLKKGENIIIFTKLSSQTVEKSIQVNSDSSVTIQSISFQVNYLDSITRIERIKSLQARMDSLDSEKLVIENTLYVLKNEEELLQENQVLGGEKKTVKTEDIEKACIYYRERVSEIVNLKIKAQNRLKQIESEKLMINNQLNELNSKKEKPVGEIWVIAYANEAGEKQFTIEYFIPDAGWKPKYDIRAESVSKPAMLVYKADVFQNTDDDWSNVQLVLSSSNPSLEGTKPILKSWTIDLNKEYSYNSIDWDRSSSETSNYDNSVNYYNNIKNDYSSPINIETDTQITGTVVDGSDGSGIPGVNVMIIGTSIGTISDMEGKYTLTVPKGSAKILFSFIGYTTEELPITGTTVDCYLTVDAECVEEVVVVGYGTQKRAEIVGAISYIKSEDITGLKVSSANEALQGRASGISISNRKRKIHFFTTKKLISKTITGLNKIKENQTSVEFMLDKPYSIPSDNKNYSVDIEKYEVPVHFQYSTVPKMEPSAFLLAQITDWAELNLLSGNVNIYFEGSFIGSSELDVQKINDTLDISMGRDKAIVIDRKLKEDFNKKQGKNSTYTWEITVKNTKNDSINMIVEDQIPLTYSKDFEIELLESQDAKYDKNKGELSWTIDLAPLEKKVLTFSYNVKSRK
jgi:hypothetical protein